MRAAKFRKLPENLREVLMSAKIAQTITEILQQAGLGEEKRALLNLLIMKVFLGELPFQSQVLLQAAEKDLLINKQQAAQIVQVLKEKIFGPYTAFLNRLYSGGNFFGTIEQPKIQGNVVNLRE